ncbi:aldo/keto reductase [Neiella marina]|uniref:Aldo/keto reductase n=1 Tax=Neiella holothuriorum TaxID=2870530 RepID=A0ABS7EBC9_9GAMM|nr:aldo/keto reductase [Neiella holothuriorum]MBW8189632.1 aldo/keto reductase [Neiella holothuriorum]
MKRLPLDKYFPNVSTLSYGCMGLGGEWHGEDINDSDVRLAHQVVDTLLDIGVNHIDHADIYRTGKAEKVFGRVLAERPELREQLTIQSKCGIRFADGQGPNRYDFSEQWILQSVDNILQRLNIEQLDTLLLHRPDPLMEYDDVASAFEKLTDSGKVRYFGVSNMNVSQIEFLQRHLPDQLIVNQLEMSLTNLGWAEDGILVANPDGANVNFASGMLEYCQTHEIQLQSWGSLSQGLFSGRNLEGQSAHIHETAAKVAHYAGLYQVSKEAIVLAFLTRHPANIQPVIGTVNPDRIRACADLERVTLSREHWYDLLLAARGKDVP